MTESARFLFGLGEVLREQLGADYMVHTGGVNVWIKPAHLQIARIYFDRRGELALEIYHTMGMSTRVVVQGWDREVIRLNPDHALSNDNRELLQLITGKTK
jgi:hypothetical protein